MRNKGKSIILASSLAVVALGGLGVGCSTPYRTTGRYTDDVMISRRVKDALEEDPIHKYEFVNVDVFRGVVQLSGWTGTEEQRRTAEQIASRVQGTERVINNISIVPGGLSATGRSDTGDRNQNQ